MSVIARYSATYWRSLAEEHGEVCAEFIQAGCQPDLCYEQANIAVHFARLYWGATHPLESFLGQIASESVNCSDYPTDFMEVIGE